MKKRDKKGGERTNLVLLIIGVLIAILVSAFFMLPSGSNPVKAIMQKLNIINSEDQGSSEGESVESSEEGSASSSSSGGGGGGSGDGGGSSPQETENGCYIRQVSYSLENMNTIETCNSYQDEICVDKSVVCSAEVRNRDSAISGIFSIELSFVEDGKGKNEAIEVKVRNLTLGPGDFQKVEEGIHIQSTGLEGIANKVINCFFNTLEVPSEEVCGSGIENSSSP